VILTVSCFAKFLCALIERDHLEDLDVGGRIILKWILRKWNGEAWTGFLWLRIRDMWRALVNSVMNLRVP
jgi:hypothetical protein